MPMLGGARRTALHALALAALFACDAPAPAQPARWTVWISPEAPAAVRVAADDVAAYLAAMGREVERGEGAPPDACELGEGHVVFVGDGLDGALPSGESDQSFRVAEERCERAGSRVSLSGGGLLGRQYAAYEWLHRLGVRFFHPEEEHVPPEPAWPAEAVLVDHTPAFRWRSVSLHLTHPLELGDAFRTGDPAYTDEAVRYIDWQLKNGASRGHEGIGEGEHRTRGVDRGFPRTAGISLHNQQQGGRPIVDPDDPRPVEEQIAAAIEERMRPADGRAPEVFSFSFNPSEFTEIPDTDAVAQITFIGEYMAEHYPATIVETTNHGTAGPPTPTYGLRYYDLPELGPPNVGVKVHSLMFYDLFRPAPVYGNESFQFLYDFMVRNYRTRHLTHFPESAWWLTFDNAVALYLPITIEARDRDIQGIAWMLEGLLDGHHVFGSGHEWGYWQNEYCSFRMAMDLDYRWRDCLRDIVSPMGEAGPEVQAVLEETVALQERDIIYGDVLAYLVGTDPETEVAASVGIEFHPLPPSPSAILRWDEARVASWLRRELPALARMDADYARLALRLGAVEAGVPDGGRPWFEEIRDGIEVTGLRARHAWQLYGALVTLRDSQLRGEAALRARAEQLLEDARATTEAALVVIHRREEGYRYRPISRSIAGGPDGTEDENWTIYRYRYLSRTHHGYYYTRVDALAAAAFEGGADPIGLSDALLAPGEVVELRVLDPSLGEVTVDWGDGSPTESGASSYSHAYAEPGVYPLAVTGRLGAEPFALRGTIGALATEHRTGFSGRITEPAGVDLIEPVLPGLVFGPIDAERLAIGFSAVPEGAVAIDAWTEVAPAGGSTALFESAPARLDVPIVNRSTGSVSAHIVVHDAVLSAEDASAPAVLVGQLDTEAVIDAVVAIGGFDPPGARRVVASTLGYTPDTLPARVAFRLELTIEETVPAP